MVAREENEQDLIEIIREINRLRISRQAFLTHNARQERRLLDRLLETQGGVLARDAIDGSSISADSDSVETTDSLPPLEEFDANNQPDEFINAVPANVFRIAPVDNNRIAYQPIEGNDISVGDRVRITNDITGLRGEPVTEAHRLGTVTKIRPFYIFVHTDAGQDTRRIRRHLQKAVIQHE